jgi:hypothetical protein
MIVKMPYKRTVTEELTSRSNGTIDFPPFIFDGTKGIFYRIFISDIALETNGLQ